MTVARFSGGTLLRGARLLLGIHCASADDNTFAALGRKVALSELRLSSPTALGLELGLQAWSLAAQCL